MNQAQAAWNYLQGRAVTFGAPKRNNSINHFPFFYPFIPYPYQGGIPSSNGNDFYTVSAADAEGPDGILVPAGMTIQIPIAMYNDCVYHLIDIKYTAWNPRCLEIEAGAVAVAGSRFFLAQPQTALQGGQSPFLASANQFVPWTIFLDASVYIQTGRDLYGGLQTQSQTQAKQEVPMPVHAMQSIDDGRGCLRLTAQLPPLGLVTVKVTNNFTQDLRVNGRLFGYKIP